MNGGGRVCGYEAREERRKKIVCMCVCVCVCVCFERGTNLKVGVVKHHWPGWLLEGFVSDTTRGNKGEAKNNLKAPIPHLQDSH